jgi:hypothetical protein
MSVEQLLTLPGSHPAAERWLQSAARVLQGFQPYPLVVRHTLERGAQAVREPRRWTETPFLRLDERADSAEPLLLDPQGRVSQGRLQRRRWIRQSLQINVYDEIFEVERLTRLQGAELELVMSALIRQQGLLFWKRWREFGTEQQQRLIRVAQPWDVLRPALQSHPEVATQALPLLLGSAAHPDNRAALLHAGCHGHYAPPAETLPYLLVQAEWNLEPGLLGLIRAALDATPERAWAWRVHPNPVVRRRLAQLLPAGRPWLDWLQEEGDSPTRQALQLRIEAEHAPEQLVELLLAESSPSRRAALGWILTRWSRPWLPPDAWKAVEKTLTEGQRQALKRRHYVR